MVLVAIAIIATLVSVNESSYVGNESVYSCMDTSFIIHQWFYCPFVGPWPLIQFRGLFTQTVGLLGPVISPPQGPYPYTE
jgi:hypothetical protein